ncbi:unnamed protein product, partial [Polarella glacialis]
MSHSPGGTPGSELLALCLGARRRGGGKLTCLCVAILAAGMLPAGSALPAKQVSFEVVSKYPHETSCFAEGLVLNVSSGGASGPEVFESCGLTGKSYVRRYSLQSGQTLQQYSYRPEHFGEGLTLMGDSMFLLTYKHKIVIELNAHTLQEVRQHPFPYGEGWGLTNDGCDLLATTGSSNLFRLRKDASGTLQLFSKVEVPRAEVCYTQAGILEFGAFSRHLLSSIKGSWVGGWAVAKFWFFKEIDGEARPRGPLRFASLRFESSGPSRSLPLRGSVASSGSRSSPERQRSGAATPTLAAQIHRDAPAASPSGYVPADAAGHFSASQDPSERRPGGSVADRLWAAGAEVQSLGLYLATGRYVRWMDNSLDPDRLQAGRSAPDGVLDDASSEPSSDDATLLRLRSAARLLDTPQDNFARFLGGGDSRDSGGRGVLFDVVAGLLPAVWLAAVLRARNLRIWTRTLLAGAVLAALRGCLALAGLTPLAPYASGNCQEMLAGAVLEHYRSGATPSSGGIVAGLEGTAIVLGLWLQDLFLGMRLQRNFVCASSFSGPSYVCALCALALYDISRAWVRRLKPQFRSMSQLLVSTLLSCVVLVDAGLDVVTGRQYTVDVTLALVLAMLLYQSPALALCTDHLMLTGLPPAGKEPLAAATAVTAAVAAGTGISLQGGFQAQRSFKHRRFQWVFSVGFRFRLELHRNRKLSRIMAELEQLRGEQQASTRRLLELEAQLEVLRQRSQEREEIAPDQAFQQELQERLQEGKKAYEFRVAQQVKEERLQLQAAEKEAQEESLRLQAAEEQLEPQQAAERRRLADEAE